MLSKQLTAAVAVIATIFGSLASNVHGHGHLVSPRSRNFVAFQDGLWSGGGSTTPLKETCPQCLFTNSGGCGIAEGRNYDRPKNALGGDLAPKIQACYAQGDVIKLDVILTAHHMGHFSYKACAIKAGEVPTQACFDRNPLTFVEDVSYGGRPDPNYPHRAYIPRADAPFIKKDGEHWKFSHRFRLPQGLSGDLVLIQWHYVTANSCLPDSGYRSSNFQQGFEPSPQLGMCTSISPTGGTGSLPEQFWNCAEVRIASNCSGGSPPPPSPPSPTISPPGPTPAGTCGNGSRGNGVCADGKCCSQFGWCGTSTEHCSGGGGGGSPPSPTPAGTCGNGNRGNGVCADGTCCSKFGWCGTSSEHCSGGGGGGGSPPSPTPTGTCGNGNRGNGVCADGKCCSPHGWCGTSTEHCSGGGGGGSPPSPSQGTCGSGSRGNGVCADGTCCSKFGWCGTSTEHCSGRMLRGNNDTAAEMELDIETEVEVFGVSIDEPN